MIVRHIGIPIALAATALVSACTARVERGGPDTGLAAGQRDTYPPEFVGQWVRLREDRTWGDTLDFRADGSMGGSQGHAVPPGSTWSIRQGDVSQFCARDPREGGYCRTFQLNGDTLRLDGGPNPQTVFRRVSSSTPAT